MKLLPVVQRFLGNLTAHGWYESFGPKQVLFSLFEFFEVSHVSAACLSGLLCWRVAPRLVSALIVKGSTSVLIHTCELLVIIRQTVRRFGKV